MMEPKQGVAFVDLTVKARTAFTEAIQPLLKDARNRLGNGIMAMAARP